MNETVKKVIERAVYQAEEDLAGATQAYDRARDALQRAAIELERCKKTRLDLLGALKDD